MQPFHLGEIAIQTCAGVREEAEQLIKVLSDTLQPAAIEFLRTQQIAIASTVSTDGSVWASLLTGSPGFMQVLTPQLLQVEGTCPPTDPLHQNLLSDSRIGLLSIDLCNRRRLRLNGETVIQPQEALKVQIQQAFFNCPKYIQTRYLKPFLITQVAPSEIRIRTALNESDRVWITQTDTFFIATVYPDGGADASHRGGLPGFVQVVDGHTLLFPDYAGNNMFQTLGNLATNPKAGLLLIDFEQGHTMQLTGKANILWDTESLTAFAGAQRLVEFAIDQVRMTRNATACRWQFGEYSPANPSQSSATAK